jgi:polysaccharide export outer membrane protein
MSVATFVSCSKTRSDRQPPAPTSTKTSSPVLAPTALVDVKVFQEPELSTSTRIQEDGRIMMPMIGEVAIGGLSVQEATRVIRKRLETRVVNPQVTLTVVEHARRMFTILGQVQRPGTFRFPDNQSLNLIQAVGIAGGYTGIGDPTKVTLKRVVDGKPTTFKLNAKRMAEDATTPVELQSDDIISVGERLF